jgi:hypothetical protein
MGAATSPPQHVSVMSRSLFGIQEKLLGFNVITAVVTKCYTVWDTTSFSLLKVNRRFGGKCRLRLQGEMFLRNVYWPSTEYMALWPRCYSSSREIYCKGRFQFWMKYFKMEYSLYVNITGYLHSTAYLDKVCIFRLHENGEKRLIRDFIIYTVTDLL